MTPDLASRIVRAAVHPAIGIARVGNSADEFFLGPEVTEPTLERPGFYRDATGALKRQATRFRVYGVDCRGEVLAELTGADAEIVWTVHLANKKAAWYEFQLAMDIPEASFAAPSLLRNATVQERASLTIDPGPRRISGNEVRGGKAHRFDTGRFMGISVYLGELQTDAVGRLVVLGGYGKSASYAGLPAITFANNDGWHDDTADGPVTAEVRLAGRELSVDPAWVVVAPPNYAPMQKSVRTMWDLMRDVAITAKMLQSPARPSFDTDIRPLFERLSRLQWVNAGLAAAFGWGAPNNLGDTRWLLRLGSNAPGGSDMRRSIAAQFRRFDRDAWSPVPWPWMYGDAMNVPTPQTPRAFTALSNTQHAMLDQWADGAFEADYDPDRPAPNRLEDVPLPTQPAMLDRAALDFCLADAFHPGCEMTWPMRQPTLYTRRPKDRRWPNLGGKLT